ncbi:hypothetical protein D3C87_1574500 [compost metagenome]
MGGHRSSIEQAGPGEDEGAVADRAKTLRRRTGIAQPGIECRAEIHERQLRPTGHQQQVISLQRLAEMPMGVERQTVGARHHPALDADHFQAIVIFRRQETIGFAEHIHGTGDVQGLDAGKHHDGDGFLHGSKRPRWVDHVAETNTKPCGSGLAREGAVSVNRDAD